MFSDRQKRYIAENSLERILNTAIRMSEACMSGKMDAFVRENAGVSVEDLQDCKEIASILWNEARDKIFKETLNA